MCKQLPACMKDISKLALQACIMNSPLSLHSLENKLAEIQKMRENVSSERNSHIFFDFAMQILQPFRNLDGDCNAHSKEDRRRRNEVILLQHVQHKLL